MFKKGAIVLIGTFVLQILHSCGTCADDIAKSLPYYDVTGYQYKSTAREGVSIPYDEFSMVISASTDFYASKRLGSFLSNNAFACDPPPDGHRGTKELLDSLVITSYYDYDENHPAGVKLNDVFDISLGDRSKFRLNDYLNQENLQAPTYITLMLNSRPNASDFTKFKMVFYLSSGETHSTESVKLTIW